MIEELQFNKEQINLQIKDKKILAIDYGMRRIGLATTDKYHISLNPLITLQNEGEKTLENLKRIIINENCDFIILGYPVGKKEIQSDLQKEIIAFKESIEKKINLPIILFDESYSSKKATENIVQTGIKKSKRKTKETLDRFAALTILKLFLEEVEGVI